MRGGGLRVTDRRTPAGLDATCFARSRKLWGWHPRTERRPQSAAREITPAKGASGAFTLSSSMLWSPPRL